MAFRTIGQLRSILAAALAISAVPLVGAAAATVHVAATAPRVPVELAAQARYKVDNTNWDQAIVSNPSPFDLAAQANIGNAAALNNREFAFTLSYTKDVGYSWTLNDGIARTLSWTAPDGAISQLRKFNVLHLFTVAQTNVPASGTSNASIHVSNLAFSGAAVAGTLDDLVSSSSNGSYGQDDYWLRSDTLLSNLDWSLTGKVKASFACATGSTCFSPERLKFEVKTGYITPIPGAVWLLGTAIAGLGYVARRRARR